MVQKNYHMNNMRAMLLKYVVKREKNQNYKYFNILKFGELIIIHLLINKIISLKKGNLEINIVKKGFI